jgi:hypothetical protein
MSLKAKAIENYDKSILALEECLKIGKCHHSFWIRKNHLALKTIKAYSSFERATQIPTNKWFWKVWRRLWNQRLWQRHKNDWKINPFDSKFKEDLTSLYMSTSQFDKALQLNELNESSGSQIEGNLIKCRFYPKENIRMQKFQFNWPNQKYPKEESNYISLIYLYSKNNQTDKVWKRHENWNSNTHFWMGAGKSI